EWIQECVKEPAKNARHVLAGVHDGFPYLNFLEGAFLRLAGQSDRELAGALERPDGPPIRATAIAARARHGGVAEQELDEWAIGIAARGMIGDFLCRRAHLDVQEAKAELEKLVFRVAGEAALGELRQNRFDELFLARKSFGIKMGNDIERRQGFIG